MPKTILIIDDDQALVAPLKEGLELVGYRVAVAFDGLQGVLQAHQTHPDVIILDFNMPGGTGDSVYERLRQRADTARIPVIFATVVEMDEVKKRIHPTAQTYFLRKPAGLAQIISVLDSVLGEKKAAQSIPPKPAEAAAPRFHEFNVRVTYADVDKLGVIYYANYFRYFEQGRTELLRAAGLRYRDLESQRKIFLPVVEANCRYLAPCRYDDLLTVRTWISELNAASMVFTSEIYDKDQDGEKVAAGFCRLAVVNDAWRSVRIPDDLRAIFEPYVGRMP